MINLDGVIGDSRKRIEENVQVTVIVRATEPCQCGHSRFLHYVVRPDSDAYACICACRGFRP